MEQISRHVVKEFSLAPAGPMISFFKNLAPAWFKVHHGIAALICFTWIPLAILSITNGVAWGGVDNPFFEDVAAHVRFLIAIPVLIGGEVVFRRRMRNIVGQFTIRGLIPSEEVHRYESILEDIKNWRSSFVPELIALAFILGGGYLFWNDGLDWTVSTWYGTGTSATGDMHLTAAGYWYALISRPTLRFVSILWYIRLFLWYVFLWRVSRIPLHLNVLHPDRAAGLGFLSGSTQAFAPMLIAHACFASAVLGNSIWHEGTNLLQFRVEIVGVVLALVALVVLPLVFFGSQLNDTRREGIREYGAMANKYVQDFWKKWKETDDPKREPFVGSADIQSLADLGNSYDVAKEMRLFPITRTGIVSLVIMVLTPFLPLVLTMVSIEDVIDAAAKLII